LPTVAAYIIGAVLFVPTLIKLGLPALGAHFFVMYYCVLSMITPPVALASFAAAGLAKAGVMETGWYAFRLSLVLFLIAFAFAFDPLLLGQGPLVNVLIAFAGLLIGTGAWAVALSGYLFRPLHWLERMVFGAGAVSSIVLPTLSTKWALCLSVVLAMILWAFVRRPRPAALKSPKAQEVRSH
jgi:TRAP-type uncharacterized transport system fused permease subunit